MTDEWWIVKCTKCGGSGAIPGKPVVFEGIQIQGQKRKCTKCESSGWINVYKEAKDIVDKQERYLKKKARAEMISMISGLCGIVWVVAPFLFPLGDYFPHNVLVPVWVIGLISFYAFLNREMPKSNPNVSSRIDAARALVAQVESQLTFDKIKAANRLIDGDADDINDEFEISDHDYIADVS